jgi:hypothetical protein
VAASSPQGARPVAAPAPSAAAISTASGALPGVRTDGTIPAPDPQANASSNASAAADAVCSIDASSWARETNQASNCDAGG